MPALRSTTSRYSFEAIGTSWHIDSERELSTQTKHEISHMTEQFDHDFSRFRSDSLVTKLAEQGGSVEIGKESHDLLAFYSSLYEITNGRVTPLVGGMLSNMGYDATYSFIKTPIAPIADYKKIVTYDDKHLTVSSPAILDFGAAGKGFLVDTISSVVSREAIPFVVDGSGDVYVSGMRQTIGLEHPFDPLLAIGTVTLQTGALCASASNRRTWGNGFHHIVDPITARPVTEIVATWVLADSTMIADGLATALFFTAPQKLQQAFAFSYVRMHENGSVDYSHDPRIELYV